MEILLTPNGTKRIFLQRENMPDSLTEKAILFTSLDSFSIWGGCDKNTDNYMSWEFDKNIPDEVLKCAVQRIGYDLK